MYKTNTKNKEKRLRATTFALPSWKGDNYMGSIADQFDQNYFAFWLH